MHPYARDLKALFMQRADPPQAAGMKRYMRDQFDYLGIKGPAQGELLRLHLRQHGLPPLADLERITRDLWDLPQREFQYVAMGLISKFEKQLPSGFIRTLEHCLVTKSWWDTVDSLATRPVGVHFKRYPSVKERYLAKWRKSRNFWLRRVAILFQLNYKRETDFALLQDIIRENLGSDEFFINKAIGWSLRQYSRVDPQGVRRFVAATPLHPLSAREALRLLGKPTTVSSPRAERRAAPRSRGGQAPQSRPPHRAAAGPAEGAEPAGRSRSANSILLLRPKGAKRSNLLLTVIPTYTRLLREEHPRNDTGRVCHCERSSLLLTVIPTYPRLLREEHPCNDTGRVCHCERSEAKQSPLNRDHNSHEIASEPRQFPLDRDPNVREIASGRTPSQ